MTHDIDDNAHKDNEELAEDRTEWAEDRTILANERTFSSWMSSAMAVAGIGLALNAIFGRFEPTWVAKLGATFFLVVALGIIFAANHSAHKMRKRLRSHTSEPVARSGFGIIAIALSLCVVFMGVILWVL